MNNLTDHRNIFKSRSALGEVLPGFEHINRFMDRQHAMEMAKILPGEYFVTNRDIAIGTVLGSCVSACIRDRNFGIGGMNHFMLPMHSSHSKMDQGSELISDAARYGSFAMEHLINDIIKFGGQRKNLEIKIFGGAKVISAMSDIGASNTRFVHKYLHTEALKISAEDTGGIYPRKIIYFPASGKVKVKRLRDLHNDTLLKREEAYRSELEHQPIEGEIELFG